MSARVGVVVRTKDRSAFLLRALRNISAQSFSDWEVVVVDDGGDHREVERIVAESDVRDRAIVVDVPRPGGRCAAANAGVRAGTSEFIVLHDDDDLWEPAFLDTTVGWLEAHPDAGGVVVSTAIVYEEHNGQEWRERARAPFWEGMRRLSLSEMLETNRAVPISFLYRRDVHERIGWYDTDLEAVEDWDILLRLLPFQEVGFIDGPPLALWTQRPDASGAEANSMFELEDRHIRDDAVVRDRELSAWVRDNGLGLPLYIAGLERRLVRHIDQSLLRQQEWIRAEIDAHQPVWSRLRRLRRRLSRDR